MEYANLFIGLLVNLLITVLSSIIPITVGFVLSVASAESEKLSKAGRIFGLVFESLSPLVVLFLVYFGIPQIIGTTINSFVVSVIGFSICFIGYLPARYNGEYSPGKNIVVNSLGLLSTVFKWSLCVGYIGCSELLKNARSIIGMNYQFAFTYFLVFLISFAVLLVLEIAKFLAKELIDKP